MWGNKYLFFSFLKKKVLCFMQEITIYFFALLKKDIAFCFKNK
jgi:hypothetical protein